jgi:hypothetical protein
MRCTHCASGKTAYRPRLRGQGAKALSLGWALRPKSCGSCGPIGHRKMAGTQGLLAPCLRHALGVMLQKTEPAACLQDALRVPHPNRPLGLACSCRRCGARLPACLHAVWAKVSAMLLVAMDVFMLGAKKGCPAPVCWVGHCLALAWHPPKTRSGPPPPRGQRPAPCAPGLVPRPRPC